MFEIEYYETSSGRSPVGEWFLDLALQSKTNKQAKIVYEKVYKYVDLLKDHGLKLGYPYIKHITKNLWELRPINNRIFFVTIQENKILFLHHFVKKSQKTPQQEIDIALSRYNEYIRRETQ